MPQPVTIPATIEVTEQAGMLYRAATMQVRQEESDSRTVELVFSTEESEVERWFGLERLGHKDDEVNMTRLSSGGAPLLMDHDFRDHIGVIESATIDGSVGRAVVRFGNSARAEEIYQDVKDGIRQNVSVGYFVNRVVLEEVTEDDNPDRYRVVDWEPYEVSIVSVPADIQAGIGCDQQAVQRDVTFIKPNPNTNQIRGLTMPTPNTDHAAASSVPPALADDATRAAAPATVNAQREDILQRERERMSEINALAEKYTERLPDIQQAANRHVNEGKTINDFQRFILDELAKSDDRSVTYADNDPSIGMSSRDIEKYSVMRALQAVLTGNRELAPLEMEVMDTALAKNNRETKSHLHIPYDVLVHNSRELNRVAAQRDMMAGAAGQGAELVGTRLDGGNFIDLLRNNMLTAQLGVRTLTGLVGNLALPKMTAGATAYWIAEGADVTESTPGTGQVGLTPKTIAANVDLTRRVIMNSSLDIEAWVRNEMAMRLALGMDLSVYNGSGAGAEPTGIMNTTGVAPYALAADPTFVDVVQMETDIATQNALIGNIHYVTTPALRGAMKTTLKSAAVAGYIWDNNMVNGYGAHATTQMPVDKMIYGNWADVIIGYWGGLDLNVDTASLSKSGGIRLVVMQDSDIAVRNPESFVVASK